jgi:hypothetical protein
VTDATLGKAMSFPDQKSGEALDPDMQNQRFVYCIASKMIFTTPSQKPAFQNALLGLM